MGLSFRGKGQHACGLSCRYGLHKVAVNFFIKYHQKATYF